jgi:subtilisin family serine protease
MKTKRIITTIIGLMLINQAILVIAQDKITPVLLDRIEATKKSTNEHDVLIILKDRVNFIELNRSFKENNTTVQNRAKQTIHLLHHKSEKTQADIVNYLNETKIIAPKKVKNIKQYWITNAITATITTDIIYELDKFPEVEIIDLDERSFVGPQVQTIENSNSKIENGVEPGLKAINAPKMWALGYTGKNRIALGYDTGVNFKHPAIANRFLGKFFPLPHVYYSMYDFQHPVDISPSSHGTHTIGTVLGLDKQNNDTIGVAYNAYWMATDPIVSSDADIRPFHIYMDVFEWVLNPDGDTATVSDIPDAVNNSWGLGPDHEYYECDPVSSYILDAVDAAGIANVFSAGNEGPDDGTVGMPANIARSEVNVFSVGAVNGNSSAYTIAGFSSRGPTPCYDGDNASIKIKPEVVAPGENVRSAQGQNEYGSLSGTSMAAPHVTGAVLLLKEAFPQLPGSEILYALYNTAHDLGDPGEDNVYGKGIIDVFAAYEYLAETNTPVPPVSNNDDIAIESVNYPDFNYTALNEIEPEITVVNHGSNDVDVIYVNYEINNGEPLSYEWTGSLNTQVSSTTITLPAISTVDGRNNLTFDIQLAIDVEEADRLNNKAQYSFNKLTEKDFPYIETFEEYTNLDLENNWAISNDDFGITWRIDSTGGIESSNLSASMKFFQILAREGQFDALVSPIISTGDDEELNLKFSYSYAARLAHLYKDSLKVYLSTDQGQTFPELLFADGGQTLATHDGDISYEDYFPEITVDWKEIEIDLSDFVSNENIVLKFVGINDNGNNLFIDNIKVYSTDEPTLIKEKEINEVIVYPNPAQDELIISNLNSNIEIGSIRIYNVLGKEILKAEALNSIISIDMKNIEQGMYIVIIQNGENIITKKIYKQ